MKEFNGYELSQKELESILGVSKPQAWRIYTGKSKLTDSNKRVIELHFENLDIKYKILEEKSKEWCKSECELIKKEVDFNTYVSWGYSISNGQSECFIYKVTEDCDIDYINDMNIAISNAKTDLLIDELVSLSNEELSRHIYKSKVITIK